MLCAISGEAPQEPVVSKKSGNVFEKRLIEAYVADNGRDPITNEELTSDDLLVLSPSNIVKPRPPTLTSIPALLTTFQNEWDALVLETYKLRQQLSQTRQELSNALYQNDAATRVVARLTRERDESREALSKISVAGNSGANGESMQLDSGRLSEALVVKIESTRESLSKTRRKRPIPEDWATSQTVESLKPKVLAAAVVPKASCFSVKSSGDLAVFGSGDGSAGIFSIDENQVNTRFEVPGGASAAAWSGSQAVLGSTAGSVTVFEDVNQVVSWSKHSGAVTAVCVHPSGALLASASVDKTFVFYDLDSKTAAFQIATNSALTTAAFHPDGHLFAAGGSDGEIKIFDVMTGASAAQFMSIGPIQSVAFSENGTWLASVSKNQTSIQIWDLRKASQIKSIEAGNVITNIEWDYTGQFLLVTGPTGISVQHYSKGSKEWSEPLRNSNVAIGAGWGQKAASIVVLDLEGSVIELR